MKITKIGFEQLFPTGQFANQRLYIEATFDDKPLEDLADTASCYQTLKDTVEQCFQHINPNFKAISGQTMTDYNSGVSYHTDGKTPYTHPTHNGMPPVIDRAYERAKETVEKLIDDAEDGVQLASHWNEAQKYGLIDHYTNRLKELS